MNESEKRLQKMKVPIARAGFADEEPKAAYDVVKSEWLIFGPKTAEFEKEFAKKIGVKHAIAVNSGSSALLVAQQALGIGRGDEVIVPDMTFVSTATSSMYLGAKPVFADITLDTYCINPAEIEKKITDKTKALIPVHYAGQSAEMDEIIEIARKHNLYVLEDAAEAHLAEYKGKKVGTIGDIAIFSFTPTKPMITGEGGMIVTNNDELAEKCRLIKNFGDTAKFQWDILGFNFRMPEVMGAIGKVQLSKLEKSVEIRRSIARRYTEEFSELEEIITPYIRSEKDINFQLYTIRLNHEKIRATNREFIDYLVGRGIGARLYYPPLHNQMVFKGNNPFNLTSSQTDEEFPNTISFGKTALSLPIFPAITEEEVSYVIKSVKEAIQKNKK